MTIASLISGVRRNAGRAGTQALTLAAIGATLVNVRREFFPSANTLSAPLDSVSDWQEYAKVGRIDGPPAAPVHVTVFSSYLCDACRATAEALERLKLELPERVSITWRHVALSTSPLGDSAAAAALCAAQQGRFLEMHRSLFGTPPDGSAGSWEQRAREAGVRRLDAFAECMGDNSTRAAIEADQAASRLLGVSATPTILVNHAKYRGLPSDFDRIVYAFARRSSQ